ncbi:UNVERIFIED_CONTAM: hypothetical protein K2H54_031289 [Gekko kuhli]
MYIELVKSSCQFRAELKIIHVCLQKPLPLQFYLVALDSGTLDTATNDFACNLYTLVRVFFVYNKEANAQYLIVHNQHFCIPLSLSSQSGSCSISNSNLETCSAVSQAVEALSLGTTW